MSFCVVFLGIFVGGIEATQAERICKKECDGVRKLLLLVIVLVLFSGCGGGVSKTPVWSLEFHGGEFKDKVQSTFGGWYNAQQGYEYVVFDISITNLKKEPNSLSFVFVGEGFDLITKNGNRYTMNLVFASVANKLPEYYHPNQTRRGNIFFEIPTNMDFDDAKLVFKALENPKDIVVNLVIEE